MRRNNAKSKVPVYNPGRGITGQTLLYQHMSNHYRRILNAKKSIDTAPPVTYKPKNNNCSTSSASNKFSVNKKCVGGTISPALTERTTSTCSNGGSLWGAESCFVRKNEDTRDNDCTRTVRSDVNPDNSEMKLINHLQLGAKSGTTSSLWKDAERRSNSSIYKSPYQTKNTVHNSTGNLKKQTSDKNTKFSAVKRKLPLKNGEMEKQDKTGAVSDVKCSDRPSRVEPEVCNSRRQDNTDARPRENNQTSSRDSAYNGGVSSLPESRSPTPDQRRQKNYYHSKDVDRYYDMERDIHKCDSQIMIGSDHDLRGRQLNYKDDSSSLSKNSSNEEERDYLKKKIKEEALYTNFIRDITAEVLERGLFTNKALKKIMKRHVLSNLWLLDEDRMLVEIDRLRSQLGIPDDEDLTNIKVGSTGSTADIDERCSVASDSEFTPPRAPKKETEHNKRPLLNKSNITKKHGEIFPKSVSDVMYQRGESKDIGLDSGSEEEDGDVISVIQVTKLVRDKPDRNKETSDGSENVTQGHSADESEQSSDHICRRKKVHPRPRRVERTPSSSDRDSRQVVMNNKRFYTGKIDGRNENGRD
ncbi:UNVERIFIED_CONTAM: hypothetical protein PYX00_007569 [Menopon gallinae]|uniref:Uncharacterized protein n=1 Tax=Menopon gallinae TaxID=328185 RepID=A0AAW2HKJ5_9NEOP